MPEPWQIGDLARQDLYPDERYMQPPLAIPASPGEGYAGLGGDPSHLASTIKNWWTNQPSWLERAQAENQKTTEAFQRGGMGEIAKQLATDTTEPQELYGAFGVGNIRGVRGQLPGNEGLSYLLGGPSQIDLIGKERGTLNPNGISRLSVAGAPEGYGSDRLVYTKDGQIVGAMQITKTPDAVPTIANTFVHPDYRRQGIATELNNQANSIYGNLSRSEGPSEAGEAFRKSLGKMGELAAVDEYRPPFYSAVEQAVQGAKQNAAPGQQWAGFLRNQPGVKQEEVQALGLGKLFEQPSVSKEAVLGEIAANRVNVGEVVKGLPYDTAKISVKRVGDGPNAYWESFDNTGTMITRHPGSMSEAQALGDAQTFANIGPQSSTKFQQYTLPGGENYREMLLTLPEKGEPSNWKVVPHPDRGTGFAIHNDASGYGTTSNGTGVAHWSTEGQARRAAAEDYASTQEKYNFKSSHYDEPNILAHVRYNDRVIDGKKTLFVEEVQSDWHQKGKREGYRSEPSAAENELLQLRHKYDPTNQAALSPAEHARMSELESQVGHGLANKVRESAVPDAPFKTTWPELAMKRIIREAAEKGYDKVAWTPGSVQAERYDLSKHIDHVSFNHNPTNKEPGKIYVAAHPHGGGHPVIQGNFTPKEIEANLGKEIADQIVNGKDTYGAIQKEGLRVGGEGMKGFYDEILPATVNRLVKKHGGRVGKSSLPERVETSTSVDFFPPNTQVHSLDITPSLRAAAMKGFPLFSAGGVAATGAIGELARQDEYR